MTTEEAYELIIQGRRSVSAVETAGAEAGELFGNLVVVCLRVLCAFVLRCETVFPDYEDISHTEAQGHRGGREEARESDESRIARFRPWMNQTWRKPWPRSALRFISRRWRIRRFRLRIEAEVARAIPCCTTCMKEHLKSQRFEFAQGGIPYEVSVCCKDGRFWPQWFCIKCGGLWHADSADNLEQAVKNGRAMFLAHHLPEHVKDEVA